MQLTTPGTRALSTGTNTAVAAGFGRQPAGSSCAHATPSPVASCAHARVQHLRCAMPPPMPCVCRLPSCPLLATYKRPTLIWPRPPAAILLLPFSLLHRAPEPKSARATPTPPRHRSGRTGDLRSSPTTSRIASTVEHPRHPWSPSPAQLRSPRPPPIAPTLEFTSKVIDDQATSPSEQCVQKERMVAEDMYVLSADGKVLSAPVPKPWPHKPPKCTDCAPLFMKAYLMRGAGAVIHSHGMETCIATMLDPGAKEFRITHMEMIKGIKGHGYHDELVIPIIENTPYEYELTDSLSEAIAAYPKATAVLVRNHGIYVWGDSWINAKTQAECYHYLFDAAIKLYQLGIDWTSPEHGPINSAKRPCSVLGPGIPNGCHAAESSKHCVVLDIEGTTTPISFVTDVMFPYACDNVRKHLTSTYDSEETREGIKLLRIQVEEDLRNGIVGSVPIPPDDAGKEEVINSLVANVESMIKADRKITSLKQLQGHIWRTGFERKELQGVIFEDVPEVLKNWHARGMKVYIYSSGSREAQRLLFGNTTYGDLRQYLCGFFDTTTGNKRESRSYFEISKSLGVVNPSQILFITDVFQEAVAAKDAGFEVIISIRPGNVPLPENHGFRTIKSFSEI